MSIAVHEEQAVRRRNQGAAKERALNVFRYLRRNRSLLVGLSFLFALFLFVVIGRMTVDIGEARPMSVGSLDPPSRELPFGSDKQGRNLYAVMVQGTPLTFRLGLIAGVIGVTVGAFVGFVAGYYGGVIDDVLKVLVDVGLTIPGLLILIIIAMNVKA
ncbi:MAG: hypothetical protein M3457_10495, partial [Chloroflexota bacterium]|nr:hypothetical protein [Chloroflexota bacterium]